MTERVRPWTDVVTLPMRNPVMFAKDMATIDVLSGGRLTLGVGIGAWDEDYVAAGSPTDRKRQRMDAAVATMRKVWAQEPPVEGHHPVGPTPVQAAGIPLVAGVVGPKALARAAKWAVGVSDPANSLHFDAENLAAQRERVAQAWQAAGRTDKPHFSTPIWFALGPDPETQLRDHVREFWDQEVVATTGRLLPHGCDHRHAQLRAVCAPHGCERRARSGPRRAQAHPDNRRSRRNRSRPRRPRHLIGLQSCHRAHWPCARIRLHHRGCRQRRLPARQPAQRRPRSPGAPDRSRR
uniref:Coenzyme F420-dependent N5 N10-methylene tetrahydromethanopterin reductase and related flavin-dependent oxidoreductases-like protein n=1 Tax=Mycolicibacterium gilvum (strain PYR-GCK) TaxID=350054 RepID=A4TAQ9_MYCGI|nr:Coenzyme F420-dependent N5 N10-methylene tetrahydromethanopterin reductase and related flavin-dependent oxidoreductases-like protein [Mycolicibacterium gilvum PYR-GCK]